MNLAAFLEGLPRRYYAWGSVAPQPLRIREHSALLSIVRGMTAPGNLELLAWAVACLEEGECYLETGTWHGATLIGAIGPNHGAQGWAIDDMSMTGHDAGDVSPMQQWHHNTRAFGLQDRALYINGTVPAAYAGLVGIPPVGVFLFDGDKSTEEAAWEGIEGALPLLARRALIVLDDSNTPQIRQAAWRLTRAYPSNCAVVLDIPTPANCYPTFWDGVMCIAWEGDADA